MAITLRDSFIDVRITEDELKEHVLDVIKARPTGAERRSAIAYLRQIVQKDARDIAQFQYINARAKQVHEERERLHTFDIRSVKHASLFTTASNVNYATLRLGQRRGDCRRADHCLGPEHHRGQCQPARNRHRLRRGRNARLRLHRQRRAQH